MHNAENIKRYPELGKVSYVKSNRARRLAIRISHRGEVRVTMPNRAGLKQAEAFLLSRKQWILGKKEELTGLQKNGLQVRVGVIEVRGKKLRLGLPEGEKLEGMVLEEAIWKAILPEAREYLVQRTLQLAVEQGIRIEGVRVRRMLTRWGSCSSRNTINLNSWLVMLPGHLSDYVILHELAHTRHRNHGAQFWHTLDGMTGGNSAQLRKELATHRIMLINTEE